MKTIRSKIILITLAIALLPLIPIGWLANTLMQQSYEIGVNPQVEEALRQGVDYSKQLYQVKKKALSDYLNDLSDAELKNILAHRQPEKIDILFKTNDNFWKLRSLQIFSPDGELVWPTAIAADSSWFPGKARLSETTDATEGRMIFANRKANRFFAVERREVSSYSEPLFLCLTAQLDPEYLASTEQALNVYQLYQTLDITSLSVPQQLLFIFLLLTLFVALLAIAVAIWLSRRITRPLGELVRGTREIGSGNLDYRLRRQSKDEIGDLVIHFNSMAEELKTSQERTIYLERMAAWQEIARRMAHEIKNPLTPIQLTMQEMVDQYSGNDAEYSSLLKECREIINEEIESLRRLVNEFSSFGRLPELVKEPTDVNALVSEITAMYSHLSLDLQLQQDLPAIALDSDRMRRVIINLIENAAQAIPNDGKITIITDKNQHFIRVDVKDNGTGIPADVVSEVFTPYFSTKSSGMGLGLAITRKIIEEHSGSITVNSVVGEGTVFTILLPLKETEE